MLFKTLHDAFFPKKEDVIIKLNKQQQQQLWSFIVACWKVHNAHCMSAPINNESWKEKKTMRMIYSLMKRNQGVV